jgi:hypothetical protein
MAKYVRADSVKSEQLEHPVRTWLIEMGLVPAVVAIGLAMTGYVNFYFGLVLLTLGIAIIALLFWFKNTVRTKTFRVTGVAAVGIIYAITLWFLFVAAPLNVIMGVPSQNYQTGQTVLGFQWTENYRPVNVSILNDTSVEYSNFDSYYHVDTAMIAKVGIFADINNCIASPEVAAGVRIAQVSVDFTGSNGSHTIPLFQPQDQTASQLYRVHCDKLAPHSRIDLVFALATKEAPRWMQATFYYDTTTRPRSILKSQCFTTKCADIPERFAAGER